MNNKSDIDVVKFFQSFDVDNMSYKHHEIVDRVCKKIDVAKVVKKAYDSNMLVNTSDFVLNDQELDIMINRLIAYYIKFTNYKVLNSLLKISDNILYEKHRFKISFSLKKRIYELVL